METPSSAITEVAGRKKAAKAPAKKTFANTSPPKSSPPKKAAPAPAPAPAPTADGPGRGRKAVTLKDGRVKADVLKELKGQIAASKTELSNHGKSVTALDKELAKTQAMVDTGKAAAANLKALKPKHKEARAAFRAHDKAHGKLLAEHDKVKAYQPK